MKILAVDTTTSILTLSVYNEGKVCEYNLEVGRKLSALIALTIERVLDAVGLNLRDLDYLACGIGPGSFTGIRVGLATIKGISWSLKKPVVGVSSLDILAYGVKEANRNIIPIIDARRGLVYASIYRRKGNRLIRLKPYMLIEPDKLFKRILGESVFLGDALGLYRDKIRDMVKGSKLLDRDYWFPRAHNLIELAQEKINKKDILDAFRIKPVYLYAKDCQIKKCQMSNVKCQK